MYKRRKIERFNYSTRKTGRYNRRILEIVGLFCKMAKVNYLRVNAMVLKMMTCYDIGDGVANSIKIAYYSYRFLILALFTLIAIQSLLQIFLIDEDFGIITTSINVLNTGIQIISHLFFLSFFSTLFLVYYWVWLWFKTSLCRYLQLCHCSSPLLLQIRQKNHKNSLHLQRCFQTKIRLGGFWHVVKQSARKIREVNNEVDFFLNKSEMLETIRSKEFSKKSEKFGECLDHHKILLDCCSMLEDFYSPILLPVISFVLFYLIFLAFTIITVSTLLFYWKRQNSLRLFFETL